jgi:hypothetical protein
MLNFFFKKENKKSKTDENNHEPEGCVAGA